MKSFSKAGYIARIQTGSHVILKKEGMPLTLSVPLHREIKRGTLRDLISDSGMSVDEFVSYL